MHKKEVVRKVAKQHRKKPKNPQLIAKKNRKSKKKKPVSLAELQKLGQKLIRAVRTNQRHSAEHLLRAGAPVDYVGRQGRTPAQYAL